VSAIDLVIKGAQLPDGKIADICIQGESIIDVTGSYRGESVTTILTFANQAEKMLKRF
jgi:hypothetical protein